MREDEYEHALHKSFYFHFKGTMWIYIGKVMDTCSLTRRYASSLDLLTRRCLNGLLLAPRLDDPSSMQHEGAALAPCAH